MPSAHETLTGIYRTFYVRDRRVKTSILGVKDITYVDKDIYDLTNYRDDLTGGQGSNSHGFTLNESTSFDLVTPPSGSPIEAPGIVAHTNAAPSTQYRSISDVVAHIKPRNELKKRTQICLWAGKAQTMVCSTNSTTTVTAPSTDYLSPGQALTGTGITSGTTIVSITNATSFVISTAATATGSASLTFDGGVLLFFCWADEFKMAGPNTFTQI